MSKVLLLLLFVAGLHAQSTAGVLAGMAAQAGVIFAGQVVSVTRHDAEGYVDIQFQVENAVRGCSPGTYTAREWAGRWLGHPARYLAGQRLLMLLTAPGPAGLSAPVYGTDGVLPIVAGASFAGAAAEPVVDLRLLATRVAPPAQTATKDHFILVAPLALDGTTAVWPALSDVLTLLRGAAVAH